MVKVENEEPFFGIKIYKNDQERGPEIDLYFPFDGIWIRQKFVFDGTFLTMDTDIFDVLYIKDNVQKDFTERYFYPQEAEKYYEKMSKECNFYERMHKNIFGVIERRPCNVFNPNKKYKFYYKKGEMYSGSALILEGFKKPKELGCFYDLPKEELDKYLNALFA